ncbi:MAG: sugar phosphate nucleotidyltransferase [bacterium]|nr:sugar phosphate nucleotidyltransferase [bacterium]
MNYALILSGGSGTRLWPLSRRSRPKHLISLAGGDPLLQCTLTRLDGLIEPENRFIITIPEQAPVVRDIARGLAAGVIIEPIGRNNLLPLALTSKMLSDRDPEAIIAFLPADHHIYDPEKLRDALTLAFEVATEGYIITLGIPTRRPEPNFGHVHKGEEIPGYDDADLKVFRVEKFTEKPNLEVAGKYHADKNVFWNGGIFVFSATTILDLISKVQPDLFKIISGLAEVLAQKEFTVEHPVCDWEAIEEIHNAYKNLPNRLQTSIDYGLMEKAEKVATIPVEMGWNDLGGFAALADLLVPDEDGNRVAPRSDGLTARVLAPGSKNVTVFPGKRAVICLDCEDMIVVDTPDALLILPKSSSSSVRDVVELIKQRGWHDLL